MGFRTIGGKRDNPEVIKNNANKHAQYYFGKMKFWEAIASNYPSLCTTYCTKL